MFVYQFSKGKYKPTMIVIIRTFPSRSVVVCFDACKKEKKHWPNQIHPFFCNDREAFSKRQQFHCYKNAYMKLPF